MKSKDEVSKIIKGSVSRSIDNILLEELGVDIPEPECNYSSSYGTYTQSLTKEEEERRNLTLEKATEIFYELQSKTRLIVCEVLPLRFPDLDVNGYQFGQILYASLELKAAINGVVCRGDWEANFKSYCVDLFNKYCVVDGDKLPDIIRDQIREVLDDTRSTSKALFGLHEFCKSVSKGDLGWKIKN